MFLAALAHAQTPDCLPPAQLSQSGAGAFPTPAGYFDNRPIQCQTWTVAYQSDGNITGFTLAFQAANGTNAPGTYTTLTPVASSASFGTAQYGVATFNLLSATPGSSLVNPFVRVLLSSGTGTGNIRIELYGYRTGPTGGTGGGGGGGGGTGCPNPCPVEGVDAAGAAPTVPPVATAVFDGTDNRRPLSDSSGRQVIIGGAAAGAAPAGNPVEVAAFDGTDVRPISSDSSGRPIVVGGAASGSVEAGNPVPIAGNDGSDVRVVSTDSAGDVNVNIKSNVPPVGASAFTSEQQAVTGSAANLGTNTAKAVCVHALIGNTINVYAGASGVTTSTGMEIPPGQGYCWNVGNTNLIYVIASTTGASVSVTWTN
jgi:hypothetical protein